MDTTKPITTWEARKRNDMKATPLYSKRFDIERWHEQRRLQREISEVIA